MPHHFLRHLCLGSLLLLWGSSPNAVGQESLRVEFKDGRVWIRARDVSVGTILREWARVGRTTIVNDSALDRETVTLDIEGLPERAALDILLRDTYGYLAGPRRESSFGPASLGRVYVLPPVTPSAPVASRARRAEPARRRETESRVAPAAELTGPLREILDLGFTGVTPSSLSSPASPSSPAQDPLSDLLRSVGRPLLDARVPEPDRDDDDHDDSSVKPSRTDSDRESDR